jgi:hypothetical protein
MGLASAAAGDYVGDRERRRPTALQSLGSRPHTQIADEGAVVFDPDSLPLSEAYIAGLPEGLDSYPRCRVRTAVTRLITERFPKLLEHPGIDPAFSVRLRAALDQGEWMPEAIGTVTRILMRDVIFESDGQYNEWTFEISKELFARPFYRALMYVVSPSLVMLGASRRWNAFREGTTLVAKVQGKGGDIALSFPAGLYTPLVLDGFGHAFRASLVAARARNIRLELVDVQPQSARWSVDWD